jgi:hypothetical protein
MAAADEILYPRLATAIAQSPKFTKQNHRRDRIRSRGRKLAKFNWHSRLDSANHVVKSGTGAGA